MRLGKAWEGDYWRPGNEASGGLGMRLVKPGNEAMLFISLPLCSSYWVQSTNQPYLVWIVVSVSAFNILTANRDSSASHTHGDSALWSEMCAVIHFFSLCV